MKLNLTLNPKYTNNKNDSINIDKNIENFHNQINKINQELKINEKTISAGNNKIWNIIQLRYLITEKPTYIYCVYKKQNNDNNDDEIQLICPTNQFNIEEFNQDINIKDLYTESDLFDLPNPLTSIGSDSNILEKHNEMTLKYLLFIIDSLKNHKYVDIKKLNQKFSKNNLFKKEILNKLTLLIQQKNNILVNTRDINQIIPELLTSNYQNIPTEKRNIINDLNFNFIINREDIDFILDKTLIHPNLLNLLLNFVKKNY